MKKRKKEKKKGEGGGKKWKKKWKHSYITNLTLLKWQIKKKKGEKE